jgi:hypothetical protein
MNINKERADWAKSAVEAFQGITGTDDEDAVSDLLCDIMHMCDSNDGPGFGAELDRARGHYDHEIVDDVGVSLEHVDG